MGANGTARNDRRTRYHENARQLSPNCRRYTQAVHYVPWDSLRACHVSRAVEGVIRRSETITLFGSRVVIDRPASAVMTVMDERPLPPLLEPLGLGSSRMIHRVRYPRACRRKFECSSRFHRCARKKVRTFASGR